MPTSAARAAALTLALAAGGCARDLSLPPPPAPPGPGSLSGKVVRAVPGSGDRVAVEGAEVFVLNTGLRTRTAAAASGTTAPPGSFLLDGLELAAGDLLIRWDADGDGAADQQRLLRLEDLGTGPGRQIALGEVTVLENARIHGRVLLGDLTAAGGHGGTAVFVTQGPFTAFTGDDGSFVLDRLAAGTVSISIARPGYLPVTFAELQLRAGEDLALALTTLAVDPAGRSAAGELHGHLEFAPATASAASATVTAASGAGGPLAVHPDASGDYAFTGVAPGLYQLRAALDGYAPAAAANVFVAPRALAAAPTLTLTPPAALDPPAPGGGGGGPSCAENAPCQPTDPCQVGAITCPAGQATCVAIAAAINGTSCGLGKVCNAGACVALCAPGADCSSSTDPCRAGKVVCDAGGVSCSTAGQPAVADGASCGAGAVCHAGVCGPCSTGASCAAADPCEIGAVSCATGLPVCQVVAVGANGEACGANAVCHAGKCEPCTAGAVCTPAASPCHTGSTSCATGVAACGDSGVALPDGAGCGAGLACHAGACGPCAVGAACDGAAGHGTLPGGADPCKAYATVCGTGLPACAAAGNVVDGTSCGAGNVCRAGVCGPAGNVLRLVGAPHALPDQVVPAVTLQLVDTLGAPVTTPVTVTVTAPAGAVAPAAAATAAADGTVTFADLRLGRKAGPQVFRAGAPGVGAPLDFTIVADAPPDGTLLPLVNAAHTQVTNDRVSGPGPARGADVVNGLAVASDGTVYFSESPTTYTGTGSPGCLVRRIRPDGAVEVVAGGTASCAIQASGPASTTGLAVPEGLALDEARNLLYVAESVAGRVSVVDLTLGQKTPFAGTGVGSCSAPCGDGGPALSAPVPQPYAIALGPESPPVVYVADLYGIRRIDPGTGNLSTVRATSACSGNLAVIYTRPAGSPGAVLALDEAGSLFFSGAFCGTDTGGVNVNGVARVNGDGSLTLVAGAVSGAPSAGALANGVTFPSIPAFAFDAAPAAGGGVRSNLWLVPPTANWMARVDGATYALDLAAGNGTATVTGDFGPAAAATLTAPAALAFRKGTRDLYVAGGPSHSVWVIPNAAPPAATPLPALSAGPSVPAYPQQPGVASVSAVLTDAAGAPLPGRDVALSVDAAGAARLGACNPTPCATSTTARTGVSGAATAGARPGLAVGSVPVTARHADLHGTPATGSPRTLGLTVVAPPAGTVFTALNAARVNTSNPTNVPGPAWAVGVYQPVALAAAADDTLYFSDVSAGSATILRMDPQGRVTTLSPPAGLHANTMALDEAAGRLYVLDQASDAVWMLDVATGGVVGRLAGGGATNVDGPAAGTNLGGALQLRLGGGYVWIMDRSAGNGRLRRIDPAAGTIATYLEVLSSRALGTAADRAASCAAATRLTWAGLPNVGVTASPTGSGAVAPNGMVYVSGSFCGGPFGGATAWGIARVEADGLLTLVAGFPGHGLADGSAASVCGWDALAGTAIHVDRAGNLWVVNPPYAGNGGSLPTAMGYFAADGTGTVGPSSLFHLVGKAASLGPDYVDASQVQFKTVAQLAFGAHVWVGEAPGGSDAIRVVW